MKALETRTIAPGLTIETLGDDNSYSPSKRVMFNGECVLYTEKDVNTYNEDIEWKTNPGLTKEQILETLIENAAKIRSEKGLAVSSEFLRIGYSIRETRETMGKETTKPINLEYPLTPEGITTIRQHPLLPTCSYLLATQKIETNYMRENRTKVGGRIYFGINTLCWGNWQPGDLFTVHCCWNIKIADIAPMIGELFKQTSKFGQLRLTEGLTKLL